MSDLSEKVGALASRKAGIIITKYHLHPKFLLSKYAMVLYAIAMNLTHVILFAVFSKDDGGDVSIYSLLGLVLDTIAFLMIAFNRESIKAKLNKQKYALLRKVLRIFQAIWVTFHGIMVVLKVVYSAASLTAPYYTGSLANNNEDYVTALAVFAVASLFCDCIVFILLVNVLYIKASFQASRFVLLVVSIFQFLLNIGVVQVTITSLKESDLSSLKSQKFFQQETALFFHTSAFVVCLSILGVYVSIMDVDEHHKLLKVTKKFFTFFKVYGVIAFLFAMASFVCSLATISKPYYKHVVNRKVAPVLFGIIMGTCVTILVSASIYMRPPSKKNKLKVEEIDLSMLTKAQKAEFAKLITYNHNSNSGISGEAALSLMESYALSVLDGMSCKVLRVYKENVDSKLPSYENYKAWDLLDRQNMIFDDDFEVLGSVETLVGDAKPLSKNQLKKLQKKKDKTKGTALFTSENICTEDDYAKAKIFYEKLISTEALVLLTVIENYDMTEAVPGYLGRVLSRFFGKDSLLKLLTIRFGLLGFHWPFRRATFYCSTTKKPVARSAAVMEAITDWNSSLKRGEKCSMILDPTYDNDQSSKAIEASGWNQVALPASHVIDLRPYKNKSLKFYLKQIKYRNTDTKFSENGGETIETFEFTEQHSHQVIDLWKNIAAKRTTGGNTSVLIDPNEKFIMSMGQANSNSDRSILFLKLGDDILASSVLYRLGDTITSDLQGIDYSIGKDYKIYFVMMQKVIEIALKEGKNFVDFGPTTEKPKMDIGCQSIPLKGAITAPNFFLSTSVKFAASKVHV